MLQAIRKWWLLGVAVALLCGGIAMNAMAWSESFEEVDALRIYPAVTTNIGRVPVGQSPVATFRIVNSSSDVLNILNVDSGCGCTKSTLSARALKPWEETTVTLTLDPPKKPGPFGISAVVRYARGESGAESAAPGKTLLLLANGFCAVND